jgi:hypothetical protein
LNLKPLLITGFILGVLSGFADATLHTNMTFVPYMAGGLGLFGGLSYITLLILSKWVD